MYIIDGEYQLCLRIADAVYADENAGIKSIKTKLFFSNEYYSCKIIFRVKYYIAAEKKKKPSGKAGEEESAKK
jgi:hypothetical protein